MHRQFGMLEEIFRAAVAQVDPYRLVNDCLRCENDRLTLRTEAFRTNIDLNGIDHIYVIGAGKATAPMARAMEELLGDRIRGGVVVVKYGHTEKLARIRQREAGHPIPDENGVTAVREIVAMAKKAGQGDLVVNLISGGGSALTPYPLETEIDGQRLAISLEEKQAVTKALLACGATIDELNCLRKHLSLYKGGRLAAAIHPARGISLILSDVVGDHLDTIASGPTTFDATTFQDADRILAKYDLAGQLPPNLTALIQLGLEGRIRDTPKADEPIFETIQNVLIGTNHGALAAAARKAESLGLHTRVLSSQIVGEAREVAKVLCGIAKDARRYDLLGPKPLCLIFGGETTVTIKGDGKGGRNQEMALAFLAEMQQNPESTGGIYFLSAATDGNDGPTDAAGGFAANALLPLARQKNLDIDATLKNNDAYHFYDQLGHLFKTGPTNTNVCDLQLILIE